VSTSPISPTPTYLEFLLQALKGITALFGLEQPPVALPLEKAELNNP